MKSSLVNNQSPLQSPSAQPPTFVARFVFARLEDLHEVVAVELAVEVGVAVPCAGCKVLDPGSVVFQS